MLLEKENRRLILFYKKESYTKQLLMVIELDLLLLTVSSSTLKENNDFCFHVHLKKLKAYSDKRP